MNKTEYNKNFLGHWEKLDKESNPIKDKQFHPNCPKCKTIMELMHDQNGMYYKCPHCKWDSAGLYKTKDKYK